MIEFIKNLFKKEYQFTGALIDPEEKEKKFDEIKFEEIVATASPVIWKEKKDNEWRTFPEYNQKKSSMCGAFSSKKMLGILYWLKYKFFLEFAEEYIYKKRKNKPDPGMYEDDIYDILNDGVTLKALTRVTINSDSDADNMKVSPEALLVADDFKIEGKKIVAPADIDTIASIIQVTGKPILLTTFFKQDEYSRLMPKIIYKGLSYLGISTLRHYVVIHDFGLRNGVKVLKADDSAGFGGLFNRFFDKDWIKNRAYRLSYPMTFKFLQGGDKPVYDGTIISVQKCLRYEGFFPSNISLVENVGSTTRQSLIKFQTSKGFIIDETINRQTIDYLVANYK